MTDWIGIYAAIIGTIGFLLTIYSKYSPDKIDLLLDKPEQKNFSDAAIPDMQQQARFFHITVKNKHNKKTAKNCKAYLVSLKVVGNEKELLKSELPLKWEGYSINIPYIDISPNKSKKFDAFLYFIVLRILCIFKHL